MPGKIWLGSMEFSSLEEIPIVIEKITGGEYFDNINISPVKSGYRMEIWKNDTVEFDEEVEKPHKPRGKRIERYDPFAEETKEVEKLYDLET